MHPFLSSSLWLHIGNVECLAINLRYIWECYNRGITAHQFNDQKYNNNLRLMANYTSDILDIINNSNANLNALDIHIKHNWTNIKAGDMSTSMANFFEYKRYYNEHIPIPKFYPKKYKWNRNSVIIMDNLLIPEAVKVCVSLGEKFMYDSKISKGTKMAFKESINTMIDTMKTIDYDLVTDLKIMEKEMILDNMSRCLDKDDHVNSIQGFLRQCKYTTEKFFSQCQHIVTAAADKGNIIVILKKSTYQLKLMEHINKNIVNGVYTVPNFENEQLIITQIEGHRVISDIYNEWNKHSKPYNVKKIPPLKDVHIAPIYGTIKVHKDEKPIRPIVADFKNPFILVQSKIKEVLTEYIDNKRFPFIIKNTDPIIRTLKQNIGKAHKMASIDYESMYTNIELPLLYDIINEDFKILNIEEKFGISRINFIELIKTLMQKFSYISFSDGENGHILKQSKGVPMGGALSYHIAEVVTARGISAFLKKIPKNYITCLFKYVDDILIICDTNILECGIIDECINGMTYTIEYENGSGKLVFLNLEMKRKNVRIVHKWYSKKYASHRTIDYHSTHPAHMKTNIIKQLYDTIMKSCSYGRMQGIEKFRHIAAINHYPKKMVNDIITA